MRRVRRHLTVKAPAKEKGDEDSVDHCQFLKHVFALVEARAMEGLNIIKIAGERENKRSG